MTGALLNETHVHFNASHATGACLLLQEALYAETECLGWTGGTALLRPVKASKHLGNSNFKKLRSVPCKLLDQQIEPCYPYFDIHRWREQASARVNTLVNTTTKLINNTEGQTFSRPKHRDKSKTGTKLDKKTRSVFQ